MSNRNQPQTPKRTDRVLSNVVTSSRYRHRAALSQRTRGLEKNQTSAFTPPEDWYDAKEDKKRESDYKIIVQPPGEGYRHVLTPTEIRNRLSELPSSMLERLEVVQLSRMTKKKQSFPCYGMQWGTTLYLYPMEECLIEFYARPPKPTQRMEAKMYGGRWLHVAPDEWQLIWTESAIKDYYLNNILIHELGHLLDERNSSYVDRERYAEWFAIEHGYRKTDKQRNPKRTQSRRHHST